MLFALLMILFCPDVLKRQDDDWDTDPNYVNDLSEKDQRYAILRTQT